MLLYSGADPVFAEEDIFKVAIPLDDNFSPEQGKSLEKTSQKILKMVAADTNIIINYKTTDIEHWGNRNHCWWFHKP